MIAERKTEINVLLIFILSKLYPFLHSVRNRHFRLTHTSHFYRVVYVFIHFYMVVIFWTQQYLITEHVLYMHIYIYRISYKRLSVSSRSTHVTEITTVPRMT